MKNNLSIGNHVIKLNATDSSGVISQDLISLEILEEAQAQQNYFNDSSSSQQIVSYSGYNKTVYVNVPKDANESTQSETANVENKIIICHKPDSSAEKIITIPIEALEGHLNHGDYVGWCDDG